MSRKTRKMERRKHERYEVQEDAFAMVTPLSDKKGEIVDISHGGLALQYAPGEEDPKVSVEIDLFLHIFLKDISFCLLRVPIETVSDVELECEESSASLRRRSVQFGAMSQSQRSELEFFIQNHAVK